MREFHEKLELILDAPWDRIKPSFKWLGTANFAHPEKRARRKLTAETGPLRKTRKTRFYVGCGCDQRQNGVVTFFKTTCWDVKGGIISTQDSRWNFHSSVSSCFIYDLHWHGGFDILPVGCIPTDLCQSPVDACLHGLSAILLALGVGSIDLDSPVSRAVYCIGLIWSDQDQPATPLVVKFAKTSNQCLEIRQTPRMLVSWAMLSSTSF